MKRARKGLFSRPRLKNKYLSLTTIAVLFISCAHAQYDSTKVLQNAGYGFYWQLGQFRSLLTPPRDTVHLARKDSGSIAYKNGASFFWNGYKWISSTAGAVITESDPTVSSLIKNIPVTTDATTSKYYYWNNGSISRKQIPYTDITGTPDLTLKQDAATAVTLTGTHTLTNKTLVSPVINTPTGIVKGDVGLSNTDNTSDATKNSAAAILTNKSINGASNTLSNISADATIDGTTNKVYTATEKTKLSGIAAGATANSSDAALLSRANHTGAQAESTVTNLVSDLAAKQGTLSGTGYSKWSTTTPTYLTPAEVTADLNQFTTSLQGLVPASGGSARKVLHADGVWRDTTAAGTGSVSSVTATSPLSSSGGATPAISISNQSANLVLAGPASGSAATPTFRTLVDADLPSFTLRNSQSAGDSLILLLGANTAVIKRLAAGLGITITKTSDSLLTLDLDSNTVRVNSSGLLNTAFGYRILYSNTTGSHNAVFGTQGLYNNTTGSSNTAVGYQSMVTNTTGSTNTAVGFQSMVTNTTGSSNTAVGYGSLFENTSGTLNTAVGYRSLNSNTTGISNVAIGHSALYSNTTGVNIAIGDHAMYSNTTGAGIAIGERALYSATTAVGNIAIGGYALYNNTSGYNNIVIGGMGQNTTGFENAAMGGLIINTTGNSNTAIGVGAGNNNTTGSNNIIIGHGAELGYNVTNSGNIGNTIFYTSNNGHDSIASTTSLVGINTIAPAYTLDVNGTSRFTGTVIMPTPFTLGATSVTSTGTQLNYLNAATGTTGTVSTNLVYSTSPTLVTPALGTPTALVGTNITGTASGLTAGNVTTNANLTGAVTSVGNAASLGSFSSSNLSTALTDETGTGVSVFGTSPTFTTSAISPILYGSVSSVANLTLSSTSHATKGKILFGTSAYDEANNRLGIGNTAPLTPLTLGTPFAPAASGTLATLSNGAAADVYMQISASTGDGLFFGRNNNSGSPYSWIVTNNLADNLRIDGSNILLQTVSAGKIGVGVVSPTALFHLKAGTATANTAPLKLTSGTLLTTPEAGAVEFLTDAYYGTITTGAARKTFAFLESPSFTTPTISGVEIPSISSTSTITNKRITKRVGTTTSSATPTFNTDSYDVYTLTAQAVDITSMTSGLTGTPTDGQTLLISITGTASRAITWGASFEASSITLPVTTNGTNRLDVMFVFNAVTSKWRIIGFA